MKHTMSESVYASSNRRGAFVRNGRLVKAVTLALVLGFSGVVGGMVQAAGVTDTTEKGGVAVNLSDDTQKAQAKGISSIAEGEGAIANAEGGLVKMLLQVKNRLTVTQKKTPLLSVMVQKLIMITI